MKALGVNKEKGNVYMYTFFASLVENWENPRKYWTFRVLGKNENGKKTGRFFRLDVV